MSQWKMFEGITPKPHLDQHFLVDESIISFIIEQSQIGPDDVVVDVGAGVGTITRHIPKCRKIYALEIDPELCERLKRIKGIEVINGNALTELKRIEFTKILSNLPYMISEPLVHLLTRKKFDRAIMLLPKSFAEKITYGEGLFPFIVNEFFNFTILQYVPNESYYPVPKTQSVIVKITKKPHSLLQRLLLQNDKLLKNALWKALTEEGFTKRRAKQFIEDMHLSDFILEQKVIYLEPTDFKKIETAYNAKKFK
ncbi:MAG: rRNA adenine N-6-methyltransferase family protein [Candidatus Woesearchaeota archaeon]